MKTSRVLCPVLASAVVLIASACAVQAQEEPLTAKAAKGPVLAARTPSGDVYIRGRWAFRIPASAGGFSPLRRAQLAADRLNRAFAAGHTWRDARVSQVGALWVVTMDSRLIVTADARSARVFGTSTGRLAKRWAGRTVVALGGAPRLIAQQLEPIPARVAGAREELVTWSVSPTKTVPLLNVAARATIGTITVGGPRAQLNNVRSAALFEYAEGNATVRAFVPIPTTTVTDRLTRAAGVGLVALPSVTMPVMPGIMRGEKVAQEITKMGSRWDEMINSRLKGWDVPLRASTKVVPLYSMGERSFIGAAQIVGRAPGVNQAKTVVARASNGMMQFRASAAVRPTGESTMLNDVVISSLIYFRATM